MQQRIGKSVLTFFLVLALTVFAVAVLSRATSVTAESADVRYTKELESYSGEAVDELSADASDGTLSPLISTGAFVLVMGVLVGGAALYIKLGKSAGSRSSRRVSLRADMSFKSRSID